MNDSIEALLARARAGTPETPASYPCELHGHYASTTPDGHGMQRTCPACEASATEAEREWNAAWTHWLRFERAEIPKRYRNRTLANWSPKTAAHRRVLTVVRQWMQNYDSDLSGLLLCGPPGTGKTHMAVAIAVECIRRGGVPQYVPVPTFLAELRASYAKDSETRPEYVLEPLQHAGLLVLDEVAATRGTDWERETLAELIDQRYRDGRALVICTNAAPPELPQWIGPRAADRLHEFALTLPMDWPSHRAKAMADTTLRDAPEAFAKPPEKLDIPVTYRGEATEKRLRREPC